MVARSKISRLPDSVQSEINTFLKDNVFSGFEELAELLSEKGYEISKSAIGRHSKQLSTKLEAIRISTEYAKTIVEQSPDEIGAVSEALIRLAQEKLFTLLMELEGDDDGEVDISKVTRAIADLTRASVAQKRFAREMKLKLKEDLDMLERQANTENMGPQELLSKIRGLYGIDEDTVIG